MRSNKHRDTEEPGYLSWLPPERVQTVQGGPGPLTLVRSRGEASDDPASPYLGVQVLVAGEARLTCDLGRGEFEKSFRRGDFVIVPPDTDIKFEGPGTFEALSLAIPKQELSSSLDELGMPRIEDCDQLFDRAHSDVRIPALVEMLWQELQLSRPNGDLFLDGMRQSVLAAILDIGGLTGEPAEERLGRRTLDELREFIRSSLDRSIRIDELARLAGMSPSRFSQAFREVARVTPSHFVMRERIAHAKELLLASRTSIAEIALATGFCDQSHLNRQFKKHTGGTPSEFRAARAG